MKPHHTKWSHRTSRQKIPIFRRTGDVCALSPSRIQYDQKQGIQTGKVGLSRLHTTWQGIHLNHSHGRM